MHCTSSKKDKERTRKCDGLTDNRAKKMSPHSIGGDIIRGQVAGQVPGMKDSQLQEIDGMVVRY